MLKLIFCDFEIEIIGKFLYLVADRDCELLRVHEIKAPFLKLLLYSIHTQPHTLTV